MVRASVVKESNTSGRHEACQKVAQTREECLDISVTKGTRENEVGACVCVGGGG
jgi:predicted MarR family transcription regulator